eukprot:3240721-Amphidinium_carterae.1
MVIFKATLSSPGNCPIPCLDASQSGEVRVLEQVGSRIGSSRELPCSNHTDSVGMRFFSSKAICPQHYGNVQPFHLHLVPCFTVETYWHAMTVVSGLFS